MKEQNTQKKKSSNLSNRGLGDVLQEHLRYRFNLRPTDNSGAVRGDGDELGKQFCVEAKATKRNSIAVSRKTWDKLVKEAQGQGLFPLYFLGFLDETGETVEQTFCVTTPEYLENVLNPHAYVQDEIVEAVDKILDENGLSDSVRDRVQDSILSLWADGLTL